MIAATASGLGAVLERNLLSVRQSIERIVPRTIPDYGGEDLFEDVTEEMYRKLNNNTLTEEDTVEGHLIHRAHCRWRDRVRQRAFRSHHTFSVDPIFFSTFEPVQHSRDDETDLSRLVHGVLSQMSPRKREILERKMLFEQSFKEISVATGMNQKSVQSIFYRSRSWCRSILRTRMAGGG